MGQVLECRLKAFLQKHPEIERTKQGFRYKNSPHKVKLPAKFSKELCRILGILHGDGNMSGGRILITDKNKEYHETLQKLFSKVFAVKLNLFHDKKRNTYYSHTKRKALYKYFTEVLEVPKGSVRERLSPPSFLKQWNEGFKGAYLGGLFDAEGYIGKKQARITFSTTSKPLWELAKQFLSSKGIKVSEYSRKRRERREFELYIYGKKNIQKFLGVVEFLHPEKRRRLAKVLPFH